MSARRALADLLISCFSASELRRLIRYEYGALINELPGENAPQAALSEAVVEKLQAHGLVGAAFWALLLQERSGRREDIEKVRTKWEQGVGPAPVPQPTTRNWLTEQLFDEVYAAHVGAGLASHNSVDAIIAALDPTFSATLQYAPQPNARLRQTLHRLNGIPNLANGDVPLKQWLREAKALASGLAQAAVFDRALAVFSQATAAPPPPQAPILSAIESESLELTIGDEDQTVEVGYLSLGLQAARSVARLLVPRFFGGTQQVQAGLPVLGKGTGWLVGPGLLLTNYHVIEARKLQAGETPAVPTDFEKQGLKATAEFDYHHKDALREVWTVQSVVASDRDLDFALLRLLPPNGAMARAPLLLRDAAFIRPRNPRLRERVNVLQHPEGDPLRLGFRDNFVLEGTDGHLSYLTDTKSGSSGSPVLDDRWGVVALHRGSRPLPEAMAVQLHGFQVRSENFGVPLPKILLRIGVLAPEALIEIQAAQQPVRVP
jgi:endonuclease G, mitochondrial